MQRRNRWRDIYMLLKGKNVEVYSPGQKTGTCKNRYVIVKDNGTYSMAGSNKLGYSLIDVIIYYPMDKYSEIDGFKERIKSYMKELSGIKCTGNETPIIIDDLAKAYTLSIEYQILKKLRGPKYVGEIDEETFTVDDSIESVDESNMFSHDYELVSDDTYVDEDTFI